MYLYNFPEYRSVDFYETVIDKITDVLSKQRGILSVYKLGGINDPGISDLDIIAVFEEGVQNLVNPIDYLKEEERYLFTHSVFGLSENHFEGICSYNLLNNLQLLWGKNLLNPDSKETINNETLRVQIALEYMFSNIISRKVEKFYNLFSVRNILLSAKALAYDLDLLRCDKNEPLFKSIDGVLSIRANWFHSDNQDELFLSWYTDFFEHLHEYARKAFSRNQLFLPVDWEFKISRNIKIVKNDEFRYDVKGVRLPPIIASLNKRIRNTNSLFSKFVFFLPFEHVNDSILNQRFLFFSDVLEYNKKYLPGYGIFANNIALKMSE